MSKIKELLKEKILILDGVMGTMLQASDVNDSGFRAVTFDELRVHTNYK